MYAVIKTGGKQYTVKPGDVLHVEKLDKDLGAEFDINDVLLVGGDSTHVGKPLVANAKVTVVVTKQARTRKLIVFKKKRRHSFRKFKTHKQSFTELFVKSITSPDGQVMKTDVEPHIVDVAQQREDRIMSKVAARLDRLDNKGGESSADEAPVKKVAKKKVAKKAAPKKAKTPSKKKAKTKKAKSTK